MAHRRSTTLALLFMLGCVLALRPPGAQAQERPDQSDLPDIAPREVEIRGQLEIAFPSLRRQPLIGFNPPPRLPEIPDDRVPYIEEYKQESVDLPPSPLAPPSPPRLTGLTTNPPARVEVDATAGRFFSRTVRGRLGLPLGQTEVLTARLDYAGLDSYRPFEDEAPYNLFDGALSLSTNRGPISVGAEVGGFVDTYDLFGAVSAGGPGGVVPQPTRNGSGIETAAWLRASSAGGTDGRFRVSYSSATYKTDVFDEAVEEGPLHRAGRRLAADGAAEFQAGLLRLGADALFSRNMLDEETLANDGAMTYSGAVYLRLPVSNRMQLMAGARVVGFGLDAGAQMLDDALPEDRTLVAPDVRLELFLAHGAMLYAQNRPGVVDHHLRDLYERNPFLVAEPVVAPSVRTIDAEAGGRFFVGPIQIGVRAGYQDYPTFLFFEHEGMALDGAYSRGFSSARYDEATVMYGGGDLSLSIARGVQATLGVTGRRGRLSDDVAIPYFGSVVGDALVSFSFDNSKGLVQVHGTYESSRYRDRAQTRRLGDYFDLDLLATYHVTPAVKLLLAVDNISADRLERFDSYPLAPFVVRGGLGLRW